MTLLDELDLKEDIFQILLDNGFEEWEQARDLTPEILQEIGVTELGVIQQVLACIKAADSYEYVEPKKSQ